MKRKIRVGIIGYGYWGPNLLRNFIDNRLCTVTKVADLNNKKLETIRRVFPSIITLNNPTDIFNDPLVDAVVIATPISSHFLLAKEALIKNKHVLVEKPMVNKVADGIKLCQLAKEKNRIFMIDYTFLYSPSVRQIKRIIDSGEIGKIQYFDSTRINLGLFQQDINVIWDLAPHDLSILCYLTGMLPSTVQANGISHTKNKLENIAYLTLKYKSGLIAHISCSWSSPVKIRMTLLGGDKKMIRYDDLEPTEKVKIYNSGYNLVSSEKRSNLQISHRIGDIFIPKISQEEPLKLMVSDFLNSIISNKKPLSDAIIGLDVVRILESLQQSLKNNSREITFKR